MEWVHGGAAYDDDGQEDVEENKHNKENVNPEVETAYDRLQIANGHKIKVAQNNFSHLLHGTAVARVALLVRTHDHVAKRDVHAEHNEKEEEEMKQVQRGLLERRVNDLHAVLKLEIFEETHHADHHENCRDALLHACERRGVL